MGVIIWVIGVVWLFGWLVLGGVFMWQVGWVWFMWFSMVLMRFILFVMRSISLGWLRGMLVSVSILCSWLL